MCQYTTTRYTCLCASPTQEETKYCPLSPPTNPGIPNSSNSNSRRTRTRWDCTEPTKIIERQTPLQCPSCHNQWLAAMKKEWDDGWNEISEWASTGGVNPAAERYVASLKRTAQLEFDDTLKVLMEITVLGFQDGYLEFPGWVVKTLGEARREVARTLGYKA